MSYRPGKEVIRELLETASVGEISRMLDVHPSHIYNVEHRGVSPTLYKALIQAGLVDPPPKKYVVAFHLHDRGAAEELRRLLARYGKRRDVARKLVTGKLRIVENG